MSKINAEWHQANRMPKNPTLEQRLQWHLEHMRHCSCRELTPELRQQLEERGLLAPPPPSRPSDEEMKNR